MEGDPPGRSLHVFNGILWMFSMAFSPYPINRALIVPRLPGGGCLHPPLWNIFYPSKISGKNRKHSTGPVKLSCVCVCYYYQGSKQSYDVYCHANSPLLQSCVVVFSTEVDSPRSSPSVFSDRSCLVTDFLWGGGVTCIVPIAEFCTHFHASVNF